MIEVNINSLASLPRNTFFMALDQLFCNEVPKTLDLFLPSVLHDLIISYAIPDLKPSKCVSWERGLAVDIYLYHKKQWTLGTLAVIHPDKVLVHIPGDKPTWLRKDSGLLAPVWSQRSYRSNLLEWSNAWNTHMCICVICLLIQMLISNLIPEKIVWHSVYSCCLCGPDNMSDVLLFEQKIISLCIICSTFGKKL